MPRLLLGCLLICAASAQLQPSRNPQQQMKPLYTLEDSYVDGRLLPADRAYAPIDGKHLKQYVVDQANISDRYRDAGHQFWGRISGTSADAENAKWLEDIFHKIGLADVHRQMLDLPDQWLPSSWSVVATAGGKTLDLTSAQPAHKTPGTSAEGIDLEAVDVGLATDAELANHDLKGKAVFFLSTDYFSRH